MAPSLTPDERLVRTVEQLTSTVTKALGRETRPLARARLAHYIERGLSAVAATVRAARSDAITAARAGDPKPTWAEIGVALGVGPQRAQQLSERPTLADALEEAQ